MSTNDKTPADGTRFSEAKVIRGFDPEIIEAKAFVKVRYVPRDDYTRAHIEAEARSLGLDLSYDAVIRCLCGVYIAVRTAAKHGSDLIGFPANCNDYSGKDLSYPQVSPILKHLKAVGYLVTVVRPRKGQSTVYRANIRDDAQLRFAHRGCSLVQVRMGKTKRSDGKPEDGELLTRRKSVRIFGADFKAAEDRIRRLNEALSRHPLETPEGDTLYVLKRVFNDGRLDRGGRLYGEWQTLKEADRLKLTIDGKAVCEIDLKASFLFLTLATMGRHITDLDPYQRIAFVAADRSSDRKMRKLAKKLVSAIISRGGRLCKFPKGCREEFALGPRDRLDHFQAAIFAAYPELRALEVHGLEVMFIESEIIIDTIEELLGRGISSFPVHDCLLCKESDYAVAVELLREKMLARLKSAAGMEVSFSDGKTIVIGPSITSEAA